MLLNLYYFFENNTESSINKLRLSELLSLEIRKNLFEKNTLTN